MNSTRPLDVNEVGTRTAQGIASCWARLEPLLPNQICGRVRFCGLDKTYTADVKRITLNIVSPEKRLLVLEEAERKYGRAPPPGHGTTTDVSKRSAEDVKIMVEAFLTERGVQANSKAWHNAMQSEHKQCMAVAARAVRDYGVTRVFKHVGWFVSLEPLVGSSRLLHLSHL